MSNKGRNAGQSKENNEGDGKDIGDRKFIFDQYGNKILINNNVKHKEYITDSQVIFDQYGNEISGSTSTNQKQINDSTLQESNTTTSKSGNKTSITKAKGTKSQRQTNVGALQGSGAATSKPSDKTSTTKTIGAIGKIGATGMTGTGAPTQEDLTEQLHDELVKANESLIAINSIKNELCRLPLDFCQREYFNNEVNPLLSVIFNLAIIGSNFAGSVSTLTTSPIVPRKKGKLKSTINLIYDINSKCKDVYKELEKRIDIMLGEDC